MKSFGRAICKAIVVFSLLLCLATVVLWVRSYFSEVGWYSNGQSTEVDLYASLGRMALYWAEPSNDEGSNYKVGRGFQSVSPPEDFAPYWIAGTAHAVFDRGGFALVNGEWDDLPHHYLIVPCWALFVLTALAPLLLLWSWCRRGKRNQVLRMRLRPSCHSRPLSRVRDTVATPPAV